MRPRSQAISGPRPPLRQILESRMQTSIRGSDVVSVSNGDKSAILEPFAKLIEEQGAPTREILDRLEKLAPSAAACLAVKSQIDANLPFRLMKKPGCSSNSFDSFVALSYQWHVPADFRQTPHPNVDTTFQLPVSRELFAAALQELRRGEGLWCDQICIDQSDELEKEKIIGNMDTIFKAARLTLVILEDVVLSAEEAQWLTGVTDHLIQGTSLSGEDRLASFQTPSHGSNVQVECLIKLLSSSWYERAWCSHEMRVARDRAYLVRYQIPHEPTFLGTLKLTEGTFEFILWLMDNLFHNIDFKNLDPQHDMHYFLRLRQRVPLFTQEHDDEALRSRQGEFLKQADEILKLQAGGNPSFAGDFRRLRIDAYTDLVSIVFNTSGYAISCRRKELGDKLARAAHNVTEDEFEATLRMASEELLIAFALSASDSLALCANGDRLRTSQGLRSWMCSTSDIFAPYSGFYGMASFMPPDPISLMRLDEDRGLITLPQWSLKNCRERLEIDADRLSRCQLVAAFFLGRCINTDSTHSRERFTPELPCMEKLLTYSLYCGPTFLVQAVQNISFEEHLVLSSQHMRYFEHLTSSTMADVSWRSLEDSREELTRDKQGFTTSHGLFDLFAAINDLCLGRLDPNTRFEELSLFHFRNDHYAIVYGPKQEDGDSPLEFKIPVGLIEPRFDKLCRVWILSPTGSEDGGAKYRLQHKSFVLGTLPYLGVEDIPVDEITMDVVGG